MTKKRKKCRSDYIGETRITNEGYNVICVGISEKPDHIKIRFDDGVEIETSTKCFNDGSIKNRNHKSLCGVGFLGWGKYKTLTGRNKSKNERVCYEYWSSMIKRVYNPNNNCRSASYQRKQVSIQKEWYNYQNFAEWFYTKSNYREGWELDKDLLSDSNLYSENTCLFIPQRLNKFLSIEQCDNTSGRTGVVYNKVTKKFVARTWFTDEEGILHYYHLGNYDKKDEAYISYLNKKIELSYVLADYLIKEYDLNHDDIIIVSLLNKFKNKLQNFNESNKNIQ